MNFKQLAVCPPAVLKDQRFRKKNRVQADRRNLHIFAFILQHVNLPPSLRSAFTVSCASFCTMLEEKCLSCMSFSSLNLRSFNVFRKSNLSTMSFIFENVVFSLVSFSQGKILVWSWWCTVLVQINLVVSYSASASVFVIALFIMFCNIRLSSYEKHTLIGFSG